MNKKEQSKFRCMPSVSGQVLYYNVQNIIIIDPQCNIRYGSVWPGGGGGTDIPWTAVVHLAYRGGWMDGAAERPLCRVTDRCQSSAVVVH